MTAEIAILNSSGIALAADSAVTIGAQKVYNSANKLFTLSKYQPVGIMVYDSADLMHVPWEIIVKEFRAELGEKSYETLNEYAEKFWEFLAKNESLIPESNKENYIADQIYACLNIFFTEVKSEAENEISENGETTFESSLVIFRGVISKNKEIILNAGFADSLTENDAANILEEKLDIFTDFATRQLGALYEALSKEEKDDLNLLVSNVFVRDRLILRSSGVVIAGFGTKEVFPKISSHVVEGVFSRKVRKLFQGGKSNVQKSDFSTFIVPFAQDEMVWTFLTGVDPDIEQFAEKYLSEIFKKYPDCIDQRELGIDDAAKRKLKTELWQGGAQLFDDFKNALARYQRESNTQPILDMVGVLPKDELAAMAESLVNLTVFKKKVSKSVETVGGPIDVAVISKGDGFIWVKRKHYFEPELNQHFFANYFNGGNRNDG